MGCVYRYWLFLVRNDFFSFRNFGTHWRKSSLKNYEVGVESVWKIGKETLALPLDEKYKYERQEFGRTPRSARFQCSARKCKHFIPGSKRQVKVLSIKRELKIQLNSTSEALRETTQE